MPMDSTPVYRGRRRRPDLPAVDAGGERLDVGDGLADLGRDLRRRGQVGVPQPVVPDHPVLVRVGDRALLQRVHRRERGGQRRVHAVEEAVVEPHPADVERQPERRDAAEVPLVPLPEFVRRSWSASSPGGSSAHLAASTARLRSCPGTWPRTSTTCWPGRTSPRDLAQSIAKASSCSAEAASGWTTGGHAPAHGQSPGDLLGPGHGQDRRRRPAVAQRQGRAPRVGGDHDQRGVQPLRRPGRRRPPWPP